MGLGATSAWAAGALDNGGFEIDFGLREHNNVWGANGQTFGETYQVRAGTDAHPRVAHTGSRMAIINVVPYEWSGIWQQIPWAENASFHWSGFYAIQGGDLPDGVATFMKVEFYDASENLLSAIEGERHRRDTKGKWVADSMHGMTPAGTTSVRFVLIAGDAPDGKMYTNRIYWDDAEIK